MANQPTPEQLERLVKLYQQIDRLSEQNARSMADIAKNAGNVNKEVSRLEKEATSVTNSFSSMASSLKDSLQEFTKINVVANSAKKSFSSLQSISSQMLSDQSGYSRLTEKELVKLKQKAALEATNLARSISSRKLTKDQEKEASDVLDQTNELVKAIEERLKLEKEINKAVGVTGNALKALSKIPGLESLKTEEAAADMREFAEELKERGEDITSASVRLKIAGKGLSTAFGGLKDTLTDPVMLLGTLVKLGFKADQQVTELGKSLGVSKSEAGGMRSEMASFARSTGDSFINTDRLLKAQTELSQELGIAVQFSNEELATFAKLTELTGLTAQEAGKLTLASKLTSQTSEQFANNIRVGAFEAMQATKTHFSTKEVLQDVSKLSAGILMKFQGNPKAIGQAVVEAKKLGSSLDQINKIGDSLLNWESSVENELKAELMTGKQLNMERARAAALSGDQLALTREISSQVGTAADYSKMNVLAQQSLAEAFGLSRDEMSEMLMKQEAVAKYGDKAAQLNKDQLEDMKRQGLTADEYLAKQEQQRAAQDKFADAIVKLQTIFANLVDGPIGKLLDGLATMAGWITTILGKWYIFYPLVGIVALSYVPKILSGFVGILGSVKDLGKGIMKAFSMDGIKGWFDKVKGGFKGIGADKVKSPAVETPTPEAGGKKGGGLANMFKGVNTTDLIKGAVALLIVSAALFVAAKAFQEFASVKWEDVALGTGALIGMSIAVRILGKGNKEMIQGAIAVAILGAALIPFAYAMSLIADLDIKNVLAAAAGLLIFGAAVFGLGALMMTGVGALLFGAGILALIALGGAMIILGIGLKAVSEGGKGIAQLFNDLSQLDADKLDKIAPALKSIGEAVLYLGAGGVMSAIGKLLGGDSPSKMIQDIAASADGITQAASGLQLMAVALQQVSSALATIDTSKLEALSEFSDKQSGGIIGRAVSGITDFITAPIKAVGEAMGGEAKTAGGTDLTPIIAAINEVKTSVDKLYNKNTTINMDGSKVGTTLTQGSYKFA